MKPEQNNVVETPETKASTDKVEAVLYSIQFCATGKEVFDKQGQKTHNAVLPDAESYSGFSTGKIYTGCKVISEMKNEGTHGLIVAF